MSHLIVDAKQVTIIRAQKKYTIDLLKQTKLFLNLCFIWLYSKWKSIFVVLVNSNSRNILHEFVQQSSNSSMFTLKQFHRWTRLSNFFTVAFRCRLSAFSSAPPQDSQWETIRTGKNSEAQEMIALFSTPLFRNVDHFGVDNHEKWTLEHYRRG